MFFSIVKVFRKKRVFIKVSLIIFFLAGLLVQDIYSQYFGRNRPSYKNFDYQLYQSPNFDIYHYFDNDSIPNYLANSYEKWYLRHQRVFKDTFDRKSPILIYENHPDFQQTTAVGSLIGIGTQGVTEALRRRVAMPVLQTNAQTDHVIGHELVHVFQFRAMFDKDSLGLNNMRNLPLWLVEGMAEYFSIGSNDAHTAMIMRDAIHQDDFPSLKEMTRDYANYNPYRYGHSFVAFFGKTWGDTLIAPLFRETAMLGYERAISRVVGLNAETVSKLWKNEVKNHYLPLSKDSTKHNPVGKPIITDDNGGHINMAPSLSPNGKYIAFYSERELFSLDLFLAETETGDVIRRLTSSTRNADIDAFNFFESKSAWSPESDRIAYIIVKEGRNFISIADVQRPRRTKEIKIPDVPAVNNLSWSPDGKNIVFSGLAGGVSNLFMYNFEKEEVIQLTNDKHSYIHTNWSDCGSYIAFSTDKPQSSQVDSNPAYHFNIGIIDVSNTNFEISIIEVFPNAENLNPVFSSDDKGLYFLSNRDGFRNMYHYDFEKEKVFRMTDFYTGISGITHLTPAISAVSKTNKIAYTLYQDKKYFIYLANNPSDFEMVEVDPNEIDFSSSTLPPLEPKTEPIVDNQLQIEHDGPVFPKDSFAIKPYKREFELTHIAQSGAGVATSRYGTGMAGAVSMLFSDITGEHQLFGAVAINGEIYDFGAQVGYLNQERRISWGGSVSHIPYPYSYGRWIKDSLKIGEEYREVDNLQFIMERLFEDQIGAFAYYPFSISRRIELGMSAAWYYYRRDAINNYYYRNQRIGSGERERLEAPDGFNLQRVNLAFVEDNSYFGMASPLAGQRYRAGIERIFGRVNMYSATLDYRRYFNIRPLTIAFRTTHYGRYGREPDDLFYPQFLGFMGYVRGYNYNSLYRIQEEMAISDEFDDFDQFFNQLLGSKVLLSGLELRLPFTGPERLAVITSRIFFTELNLFLDAGVAWGKNQNITIDPDRMAEANKRFPIFSTGASVRINLFGALILEPYLAFPFQTEGMSVYVTGLNFIPGW